MVDHRFLTQDHGVEQSTFSSGARVTVNLRVVGFEMEDGQYLPPRGYDVRLGNGEVIKGHFGHIEGNPR